MPAADNSGQRSVLADSEVTVCHRAKVLLGDRKVRADIRIAPAVWCISLSVLRCGKWLSVCPEEILNLNPAPG